MIPYFLLVLVPILAGTFGQKYRITIDKKRLCETSTISIDVFMLMFLLLLCFRGLQCGSDTNRYLALFEQYRSSSILSFLRAGQHELGYRFLNKLIGSITDNYQSVLIVTSIISVGPLWYFYRQQSEKALLTIAIFLSVAPFMMYFSGIRQAIAMVFVVPCWYASKKRKRLVFLISVLVAMQFHTSAFILLAIYPLYHANITKKWLFVIIPVMLLVYYFKELIFNFLLQFLWKEYDEANETGAITILLLLILFGIYSYVIPDQDQMDEDAVAMRNFLLFSIMLQCFAPVHQLSMRLNYYFLLFVPISIPKFANRSRKDLKIVADVSVGVMTVYFLYYYVNMVVSDKDPLNIIPYIPYWQN